MVLPVVHQAAPCASANSGTLPGGGQMSLSLSGSQGVPDLAGMASVAAAMAGPARMSPSGVCRTLPAISHLDMTHGHTSPEGRIAAIPRPAFPAELGDIRYPKGSRAAQGAYLVGPDPSDADGLQLSTGLAGALAAVDGDYPGANRDLQGDGVPDVRQGARMAAGPARDRVMLSGQVAVVRRGQAHVRAGEQVPPGVLDVGQVAVHLDCQSRADRVCQQLRELRVQGRLGDELDQADAQPPRRSEGGVTVRPC